MSLVYRMLLLFTLASLSLHSCKKDNDPPANEISDDGGLSISLTWSNSDGSDPIASNNLDLYIFLGNSMSSAFSSTTNGFEGVTIPGTVGNEEFRAEAYFTKVQKSGTLILSFQGINSGKKYEVSHTSVRVPRTETTTSVPVPRTEISPNEDHPGLHPSSFM